MKEEAIKKEGGAAGTKPAQPAKQKQQQALPPPKVHGKSNKVNCTKCAREVSTAGIVGGQWFQCPHCRTSLRVPDTQQPAQTPQTAAQTQKQKGSATQANKANASATTAKAKIKCPKCSQTVEVERMPVGQLFNCPNCQARLKMPETPATAVKNSPAEEPPASKARKKALSQMPLPHAIAESYDAQTQLRLLNRLRQALAQGLRDPELLYLGGRYSAAFNLKDEACRFLDPLSEMLHDGEKPAPAFFPVGLLYLQVLSPDNAGRASILEKLQRLARGSAKLDSALRLFLDERAEECPKDSPQRILMSLKLDELPSLGPTTDRTKADDPFALVGKIQQLARRAAEAYNTNKLTEARAALEAILLLDGDQPEALRNLVTITSEQQDVEAYERYWRRYVKLLLWRIMRDDEARAAREDLLRFYTKVATVTDREFVDSSAKTSESLKRPGLLSHWLEAHAALVWLQAAHAPDQFLSSSNGHAGKTGGYRAVTKFWYRVFYPEFYPFLDLGGESTSEGREPLAPPRTNLRFDPTLNLLTRFAEWAQFYFYLDDKYDAYAETLTALAGVVARLPVRPYVLQLKTKFETDELKPRSFRRSFQDACSFPFYLKRNQLRDADDWEGIIELFGDEELIPNLAPSNRLFLAYALCKIEREEEGLEVACATLPEMLPEEFDEQSGTADLFHAVIGLNAAKLLPKDAPVSEAEFARFLERLRAVPLIEAAPKFIDTVLEPVLFRKAFRDVDTLVEQDKFAEAREVLQALSVSDEEGRKQKEEWLTQIDRIELNRLIDDCLNRAEA
ncbi:MAG: hypothetical protein M3348_01030, partial [Acidobacteriota bacterium]|nr:hypothetical protein [Acidobacteriota bacterium]